jgi:glycine cleavage system aminomethyltransferase T
MRTSPFHDQFAGARGSSAVFADRFGTEVVSRVSDALSEYRTIRDFAGITDFSFMQRFRFPEEKGLDFLDSICAGNVVKLRFGRMLHTFLADANGNLVADCYIANNDDECILLCESIVDDETMNSTLLGYGAADAGMEDLSRTHAVLSIDGYKAWSVAKDLFGPDVLGLPYLSIERYDFRGAAVSLFRAGKTSEFGYLLMVPREKAAELFAACEESARKVGGALCGTDIHGDLRLEGRFFNIFAEGAIVKDPLALGLQWMIDFNKEKFIGRDALFARRAGGLTHKIIGISSAAGPGSMKKGIPIFHGPDKVAEVVASCFSPVLSRAVGLALFPAPIAFAGLSFCLGSAEGPAVETISMPPIMPKSLTVKLDEM